MDLSQFRDDSGGLTMVLILERYSMVSLAQGLEALALAAVQAYP